MVKTTPMENLFVAKLRERIFEELVTDGTPLYFDETVATVCALITTMWRQAIIASSSDEIVTMATEAFDLVRSTMDTITQSPHASVHIPD